MKKSSLLLLTTILAVSCAKEKPAEKVFVENPELQKSKELLKSFCTMEDKCVYVPSVANTPYNVTASRPFWQGEAKLVVGEIQENAFVLKEVETDDRFQENVNNRSPVLKLGIKHVDYTCEEDAYGDCTNKEKLDDEKTWEEKRLVQFDKEGFDVQEINSLPIEFGELFQSGCFSDLDKHVTKYAIENDAINVSVKKTYRASANCASLQEMSDLRYLNFTVDYHYSIVKLSTLSDQNYQSVDYPIEDKNTYGFFTTEKKVKTVDNLDHVQGVRKVLLNRFSPNKKEIVYYLNDEFYKEENSYILDATKGAMNTINFSLAKAKAGIQIKLADGRKKDAGDLRNNFLILVGDPQASGVIGYGPSVSNPETGEIVKAQTVMYYGTMKKFISRTWDEIAESLNNAQTQTESNLGEAHASASRMHAVKTQNENAFVASVIESSKPYLMEKVNYVMRTQNRDANELFRFLQNQSRRIEDTSEALYANVDKLMAQAEMQRSMLDKMSEETFFHASMFNFRKTVARVAVTGSQANDQAAPTRYPSWDELTEEQRQSLMETLMPQVWVPTLVHEFGHNLGLRHNFNGSTDKENYYSKAERSALGIENEVTYSSIMDYSYSTLNELPVMGKYDIAALKFAYARKVDAKSSGKEGRDSVVELDVKTTLSDLNKSLAQGSATQGKLELAKFKFCTDEDVNDDPLCNRFDEGTDYEEVAKHYVDSYFEDFSKRNFRNRRYEMNSIDGDLSYLDQVFGSFISMRNFFDQYDQMLLQSKLSAPSESTKKSLESLKKASDYIFSAFMEVLETPAYHCIKVKVDAEGNLLGVMDIDSYETKFSRSADLAFDMRYGCQYLTSISEDKTIQYFEFGKHFNNTLDFFTVNRDQISEMISQVDVRGFWMDKVLAAYLMSYRMSSPSTIGTNSSGNFLDHKEYKERFDKFANGLLSNTFSKTVVAQSMFNQKIPAIQGTVKFGFDDSQVINKSYNWIVNGFFGLRNNRTSIKDVLLGFIKMNLSRPQFGGGLERDDSLFQSFKVTQVGTSVDISDYGFNRIVEFKNSLCDTSYKFGLYNYNTYGSELASKKDAFEFLSNYTNESLAKILEVRASEGDETTVELVEKPTKCAGMSSIDSISKVDSDTIDNYISGRLNAESLLNSFLALSK